MDFVAKIAMVQEVVPSFYIFMVRQFWTWKWSTSLMNLARQSKLSDASTTRNSGTPVSMLYTLSVEMFSAFFFPRKMMMNSTFLKTRFTNKPEPAFRTSFTSKQGVSDCRNSKGLFGGLGSQFLWRRQTWWRTDFICIKMQALCNSTSNKTLFTQRNELKIWQLEVVHGRNCSPEIFIWETIIDSEKVRLWGAG